MRGIADRNAAPRVELERHGIVVLDVDVTDQGRVDAAAAAILARSGRVDLLINNAGTAHMGVTEAYAESLSYELRPSGVDVAIVEPGAYATNIFSAMISPDDTARVEAYGETANVFEQMGEAMGSSAGDPAEVATAIRDLAKARRVRVRFARSCPPMPPLPRSTWRSRRSSAASWRRTVAVHCSHANNRTRARRAPLSIESAPRTSRKQRPSRKTFPLRDVWRIRDVTSLHQLQRQVPSRAERRRQRARRVGYISAECSKTHCCHSFGNSGTSILRTCLRSKKYSRVISPMVRS